MSSQTRNMPPNRQATNLTLPTTLLNEARSLRINLSQACETGLQAAVNLAKRQNWLAANRDAIQGWNAHVEAHGLPLEEFRKF